MTVPSPRLLSMSACLLLLFAANASGQAGNATVMINSTGLPEPPTSPPPIPNDGAPIASTRAPCVEGENCVQGPCHQHASCASNNECIYISADDDTYCEDHDGFGGKCLQGKCIVQRQAVIKSFGDHLVFHTPTGGDVLFSSSDLSKDISLRGVTTRLGNAEDAVQSIHIRAGAIETKAENAAADHQGLITRVNALNQDVNTQFVQVNTYVGDVEAKADANADDIVAMGAKVTSNAGEINSLRDTATQLDGKVTGLENGKATRAELAAAVDDLEDQIQAEAADIRVLQNEMQTKVIKLDDRTTEHNSFILNMQANIASVDGRVDGNDADITELKQTRLTREQVQGAIDASLTPVKDKLEGDIARLRTDLSAIDLKPMEKKIELNTIVARIGAGIGPSKTLTETEVSKVAGQYCGNLNQGYDSQKSECVKCLAGNFDREKLRCRESNLISAPLSKTWSQASCSGVTHYQLFGEGITYLLEKESIVEVTLNLDVLMNGCDSSYSVQPTIEIGDATYVCMYDNYYQNYHYNYYTAYEDNSLLTVRNMGAAATSAPAETGACQGATSQTLLSTYFNANSPTYYCSSGNTQPLNSYFQQPGPWTMTSGTGRVRITFTARGYLYPYYCTSDSYLQMRVYVNDKSLGASSIMSSRNHYSNENSYQSMVNDFLLDVGTSSFKLHFDILQRGYNPRIYGDQSYSTLTVVDVPKEDRSPEAAALPTGCKGLPRRYLVQSYFPSQVYQSGTMSGAVLLRDMTQNTNENSIKFDVLQDKTRIHLYIKGDIYIGNNGYTNAAFTEGKLVPYIDNKAQMSCIRSSKIYNGRSTSEWEEGAIICEYELMLDEGEHEFRVQLVTQGYQVYLRSGSLRTLVLLEELVHKTIS